MKSMPIKIFLQYVSLFSFYLLSCTGYAIEPVSGYAYISQDTQEMQDDEFANPGMTTVDKGRALFHAVAENGKNCASCHGEDGVSLKKSRIAEYPIYSYESQRPITLQEQVNICWQDKLDNIPFIYDCADAVALETYVRYLARGEVINVDVSGPMQPYFKAGEELYNMRVGQLDMACIHCHVYHQGQKLRGQTLSQGHSNGFPEYRLQTGQITSLHRRFTECFVTFRAKPFDLGSEDFINLEIYVHARGNGLKIETPAVRY